ncbi:PREDICTED: uncharacterized protein LOC109464045 [Branchiostoma belcheri]|uniref:Uncharacterized protein LOC109464045 n=1 Tax=Branchiostoma belcheri TaxID=7741 RepID=A0A6P4XWS6_BRABE|nr:PREDICTED: uncharacterized protein LOC109464045 [Branchiostoma belcheri]
MYLDLEPYTVPAGLKRTVKHTCGFFAELSGEEGHYMIAVTLDRKEVLRVDVETTSTAFENVDIVFATFDIEIKDPTSYGVYNCLLEKNGIQYPNATHIGPRFDENGKEHSILNTFQIIHPFAPDPWNVPTQTFQLNSCCREFNLQIVPPESVSRRERPVLVCSAEGLPDSVQRLEQHADRSLQGRLRTGCSITLHGAFAWDVYGQTSG